MRRSFPAAGKALEILKRGFSLELSGKLKEAEYQYQLVLRDFPDHPEALNMLGTLASKARNHGIAIECLSKAVAAQPKNMIFRNNLGYCLNAAKKAREALPHFRKAAETGPNMPEPWVGLGQAHRLLGEGEEAEKALRRALTIAPDLQRVKLLLAEVLIDRGKIKEAATMFRGILAHDPRNIAAIVGLASAREAGNEDGDLTRFEFALKEGTLAAEARASLHSALGQICDQRKQPKEAFRHFIQANEIEKAEFSLQDFRIQVDELIATFTPFLFMKKHGFGDPSERPIFVVGMPRSGTTLTEQILSSHPLIEGAGELPHIQKLQSSMGHTSQRQVLIRSIDDGQCKELARRYLAELDRHSRSAARVVDKMPHNFMHLGFIALMFPKARIVHCQRDAIDNCVSIYTHRLNRSHSYSTDLKTLGLYYREYRRVMRHWQKVMPLKIFELHYEQMIGEQESTSRSLIDFAGLEWNEACLTFHETERTVRTLSRWQVRQPLYSTSVKRWKKYEEFLGPLIEGLGDLAELG
jgi:Flp pilus assembly protein TadD